MSKITRLIIDNFRSIGHLELDLHDGMNYLDGRNGRGKSTIACGVIPWLLGNTNMTDKWGVGENDVEDNIPVGMDVNDTLSVTAIFEGGTSFTKQIKAKTDKNGKVTGYPVTYKKGLTEFTKTKWTDELYKEIRFSPFFTDMKKEINLYFDMLDALQKRDPKELRKLLINLGCDVSYDDAFEIVADRYDVSGIKVDLQNYGNDIYALRKEYKKMNSASEFSVKKIRTQLEAFNSVQEFNQYELDDVEDALSENRKLMNTIGSTDAEQRILEIQSKINVLQKADSQVKRTKRIEYESKLSALEKDLEIERKMISLKVEEESKDLKNELSQAKIDLSSASSMVNAYERSLERINEDRTSISVLGKNVAKEINNISIKLEAERVKTFDKYIDCPICGSQFVLDPNAEALFNSKKESEIRELSASYERYTAQKEGLLEKFNLLDKQRKDTEKELSKAKESYDSLVKKCYDLEMQIKDIANKPKDETKIRYIEQELVELTDLIRGIKNLPANEEIAILEEEIASIQAESDKYANAQKDEIQNVINELDMKRTNLLINKSKWEDKCHLKNQLNEAITYMNDMAEQVVIVNEVVKTLISLCNKKASEITGFEFVMLEENLGNDNVSEVCYMVVDGVPFDVVNTSKKFIYGIKFIKKMKEILERDFGIATNDVPILFDKIESIDKKTLVDNKDVFEGCQLICTRVTDDETLTLRYE